MGSRTLGVFLAITISGCGDDALRSVAPEDEAESSEVDEVPAAEVDEVPAEPDETPAPPTPEPDSDPVACPTGPLGGGGGANLLWVGVWQVVGFLADTAAPQCGNPSTFAFPLTEPSLAPTAAPGTFHWMTPGGAMAPPTSVEVALSRTPGDFSYWRSGVADCGVVAAMTNCSSFGACTLDWSPSPTSGRCTVTTTETWYVNVRFADASGHYACAAGSYEHCTIAFSYVPH